MFHLSLCLHSVQVEQLEQEMATLHQALSDKKEQETAMLKVNFSAHLWGLVNFASCFTVRLHLT